jgi:hypothetical protein
VSYTLTDDEYKSLDPNLIINLVDLDKQFALVTTALQDSNRSTLMLGWCRPGDAESWTEDHIQSSEPTIKYVVDGKELVMREHMPYFCFIGADIIEFLWKMQVPTLTSPPQGYNVWVPYKNVALEELRNMYGVYHFEADPGYEGHGYIWYMKMDTITVMNTYGGVVGVFIQTYKRDSYLDFFMNFSTYPIQFQADNYHLIFDLPVESVKMTRDAIIQEQRPVVIMGLKYRKIY